jgi:hypothetical protein
VLRYVVKYADGATLEVPVRWGDGIEQNYRTGTVGPMLWAQPVWQKPLRQPGEQSVVYALDGRPQREMAQVHSGFDVPRER